VSLVRVVYCASRDEEGCPGARAGPTKPFGRGMKLFLTTNAVSPKRIAWQDGCHWSNGRVRSCGQSSVLFIGHIATSGWWKCDAIIATPATLDDDVAIYPHRGKRLFAVSTITVSALPFSLA